MNRQAVLDVLNSFEVIDKCGGEDAFILVDDNQENRSKLYSVGITDKQIDDAGDCETFCILALAFQNGYADSYVNGQLIIWGQIDDDLRHRVMNGEGTASDAERLLRALEPQLLSFP